MTELLVGTKKGLFVLRGEAGSEFEVAARSFAGEPVEFAMRDPRSGRYFASVTSAFYGPKIFVTDDPAGEWEQAEGPALPEGGDAALKRIWTIVAGEEACACTRSRRGRVIPTGSPSASPRAASGCRTTPARVGGRGLKVSSRATS